MYTRRCMHTSFLWDHSLTGRMLGWHFALDSRLGQSSHTEQFNFLRPGTHTRPSTKSLPSNTTIDEELWRERTF